MVTFTELVKAEILTPMKFVHVDGEWTEEDGEEEEEEIEDW